MAIILKGLGADCGCGCTQTTTCGCITLPAGTTFSFDISGSGEAYITNPAHGCGGANGNDYDMPYGSPLGDVIYTEQHCTNPEDPKDCTCSFTMGWGEQLAFYPIDPPIDMYGPESGGTSSMFGYSLVDIAIAAGTTLEELNNIGAEASPSANLTLGSCTAEGTGSSGIFVDGTEIRNEDGTSTFLWSSASGIGVSVGAYAAINDVRSCF